MARYIIVLLVIISGIIAWMYFSVSSSDVRREERPEEAAVHKFDDPGRSIKEIKISVFYFVPKNKQAAAAANWRELAEAHLKKLQEFHELQFQGKSALSYEIYREPVIGLKNNLEYDTETTQRGNPQALIAIAEELEARVFDESGDLFRSDFAARPDGAYPVMLILYEGVGASGGVIYETADETRRDIAARLGLPESVIFVIGVKAVDGFFLLNREYLSGVGGAFGATVLAHEFYHTLGIPDGYEGEHAYPATKDIMGIGREAPIERAYIERSTLQKMGL